LAGLAHGDVDGETASVITTERRRSMTSEEHIAKMTTAIRLAIKVMGDRFGSTEQDVANAIQELKLSLLTSTAPRAIQGDSTTQQPVNAG
jgi:hypothetical protein